MFRKLPQFVNHTVAVVRSKWLHIVADIGYRRWWYTHVTTADSGTLQEMCMRDMKYGLPANTV